jgi:hypothetical protein
VVRIVSTWPAFKFATLGLGCGGGADGRAGSAAGRAGSAAGRAGGGCAALVGAPWGGCADGAGAADRSGGAVCGGCAWDGGSAGLPSGGGDSGLEQAADVTTTTAIRDVQMRVVIGLKTSPLYRMADDMPLSKFRTAPAPAGHRGFALTWISRSKASSVRSPHAVSRT